MSAEFPMVVLGDVLTESDERAVLDSETHYKQVTVRLWGKGAVLRAEVPGAAIAAARQVVVHTNQFIVSRIDARNGAFALIPEHLDGAVVSNDFPVFTPNPARIIPSYLGWLSKTHGFADICRKTSEGTTNRKRLNEKRFLAAPIPLPPLAEQRRIVARIEELAGKIEAVRGLRRGSENAAEALLRSTIAPRHGNLESVPLADIVSLRPPDVDVRLDQQYHFAGVYSFGRGVFKGQIKGGNETSYKALTKLHVGDLVYPKLMAWEGAIGIVPPECDGLYVSPEFPVFSVNETIVLPEVLDIYFRTPSVWSQLSSGSTGTNVRRRRLHPSAFLAHKMPLPPMEIQRSLRYVKSKIDAVKRLQAETSAELDALLPSILDRAFSGRL